MTQMHPDADLVPGVGSRTSKLVDGRRVAVTGASGFIGARTVELLAEAGCQVVACVRPSSDTRRLAAQVRPNYCALRACDVLDPTAMRSAFQGCEAVIHCAYGSSGTDELRWRTTVDGTRITAGAAAAAGVRRFVHLSTAAVHDTADRDVLDERTPLIDAAPGTYEAAKREAEDVLAATASEMLAAIVLRPTVVYGPWGKDWTTAPLVRLSQGVRGLPSGAAASGVCNAVYVDDVVQAIVRACATDFRGTLIIAAGRAIRWGEFYDAFRRILSGSRGALAARAAGIVNDIESWEQALYADRAIADTGRARRCLGYDPRFSFEAGMELVATWASVHGVPERDHA